MPQLLARSLILGAFLAASSQANIFFDTTMAETPAATVFGSSSGSLFAVTRCNSQSPSAVQLLPVGVLIHYRSHIAFGPLVSGIQLVCELTADHGGSVATQTKTLIGYAANPFPPLPGAGSTANPQLRKCPAGHALTGLEGRAGSNVIGVSIRCAPLTPNILAGTVERGATTVVGNAVWEPVGSIGLTECAGQGFVRSIAVSLDDYFLTRFRVNCRPLRVPSRLAQYLTEVDLAVMPFGQQTVFEGAVTHSFSLAIQNLGRAVTANAATVDVVFDTRRAKVVGPAGCSRTPLGSDAVRLRCFTPAIPLGGRAMIPGFSITPTGSLEPMTTVGNVLLNSAVDIDPDNNDADLAMLAPLAFFP